MRKVWIIAALALVCLLPAFGLVSGAENRRGDVNGDGALNVFDLLSLLREMKAAKPRPEADLNSSGRVDIYDLLDLLGEFTYQRESRRLPFEAMVTFDKYAINQPRVYTTRNFEQEKDIRCRYAIISSHRVQNVEFVLGTDTLRELSGMTPILASADFDTIGYSNPQTFDDLYSFSEQIDWWLKLWDENGAIFADSGQTKVAVMKFQLSDFGGSPNFGKPMEFPLVLCGRYQQFGIVLPQYVNTAIEQEGTYIVDLNQARQESVVYENLDQLCETIMEQLVANERLWNDPGYWGEGRMHTYVSAAVVSATGEKTNCLAVATYGYFSMGYTKVVAIGGNEKLMNALGFPLWLRKNTMFDMNYKLDPEIYEKYKDR